VEKMNINEGFQIDEPDVFVPWGIEEEGLVNLLGNYGLKKFKKGYYTLSCKFLGGLSCELGFHFETKEDEDKIKEFESYRKSIGKILKKHELTYKPARQGTLKELEFFRLSYPNLKESFEEFQFYFEKEFGKPKESKPDQNGFMNHVWRFESVSIYHYVIDRFGPEEQMRIKKT